MMSGLHCNGKHRIHSSTAQASESAGYGTFATGDNGHKKRVERRKGTPLKDVVTGRGGLQNR